MSGISSGIGLISGLPTADIIAQYMAIEARPMAFLHGRVTEIQAVRTAFADLSARLLSLQNSIVRFDEPAFFKVFRANSSNPSVLTASASAEATPGSFTFQVHSLVSNHELISQGFADASTTPIGAGTIALEVGNGQLSRPTDLDVLNGGDGVRRGRIEITDRAGNTAEIDLTAVLTVGDVLGAINSHTAINVRARVSGDRIALEDTNDTADAGSLAVRDLAGGHVAEDLGIAGTVTAAAGEAMPLFEGADVINLVDSSLLSMLNDGNGVDRAATGADFTIQRDDGATFDISLSGNIDGTTRLEVLNNGNSVRLGVIRITTRNGDTAEVDLGSATNLQDVVDAIAGAGLDLSVTFFNSSSKHALQLGDNTEGEEAFAIEDVSGFAARDLGIATESEDGSIIGNGIHRITTIGDVMRAIQYAYDNSAGVYNDYRILAGISANGNGLLLSSLGQQRGFEVIAAEGSTAAADLGILGRYDNGVPPAGASSDLIAGLNTVLLGSLNGGAGVSVGDIQISGVTIDLTGGTPGQRAVQTLQEVIDRINAQTEATNVSAAMNAAGNGIVLGHELGDQFSVNDVGTGTLAAELGIDGSHTGQVNSGNLQLQYISAQTLLSDLNGGRGVRTGEIRITDTSGALRVINVTENQRTVGDVLGLINAAGDNLVASINPTGDGILITDTSGGAGTLTVTDEDGFAAKDLNILGETQEGEFSIDGSFETHLEIDADDTLEDVVNKINNLDGDFSAVVINDGSTVTPYRLVVNSQVSGARGRMMFDGGSTGLAMETLAEARDAVVFFGGSDAENTLVLRSSTNTLNDVIEGVTIDLQAPSDEPVNLSVAQDLDSISGSLGDFVDSYNDVIDRIDQLTSFDSETMQRGVLFADSTVSQIENRLFRSVTGAFENTSATVSRLSAMGITTSDGGRLSFDEDKFRQVYADDPDGVEQLFTAEETGFGDVFEQVLDDLTRSFDGMIAQRDSTLQSQEELLQDRIEGMQELLELRQAQMERQFAGLESALAILGTQQAALTSLQSLALGL